MDGILIIYLNINLNFLSFFNLNKATPFPSKTWKGGSFSVHWIVSSPLQLDLVKSLNLYTICDRRDYFLTVLMFKAIHGITPTYLLTALPWIVMLMAMTTDDLIWSYSPPSPPWRKEAFRFFLCILGGGGGGKLWNEISELTKCTNGSLALDGLCHAQ